MGSGREGRDGHAGAGGSRGAPVGGRCHEGVAVRVVLSQWRGVSARYGRGAGNGGRSES